MRPGKRIGRPRSIWALLATICILPFALLLALGGFAASVTLTSASREHDVTSADRLYGGVARGLGVQLTQERLQVVIWLSNSTQSPERPMLRQFRATQGAIVTFRNKIRRSPGLIDSASRPALNAFNTALNGLPTLRKQITSGKVSALAAFQAYNAIVGTEFRFFAKLTRLASTPLAIQFAATLEAGRAVDLAEREVTLIGGALASYGQMGQPERELFATEAAGRQLLMTEALSQLRPSLRAGLTRANATRDYRSFTAMERAMSASVAAPGTIPISAASFGAATVPLLRDYQVATRQETQALARMAERARDKMLIELVVAGIVTLLVVVLSLLLLARFGWRVRRELARLHGTALDLTRKRLPSVVDRLSQSEDFDVAAEATPTPLPPGRIKEIARVSEAFAEVQETAIDAAVGQARLRRGINKVFRSLASRSQSLLHRQLALLDAMERKTTDPAALDELFQLDHLTTRMRRHAESLIILSGAAGARTWPNAIPIAEVLRGAIAEVEDYARIRVVAESTDAVTGPAVSDVIHLLAELIENAAAYSPKSAEVTVRAGRVARGLAVEVEDRGVGIAADELAAINERLASAAGFDLVDADQLGLFVVSRLAAKHDIKVTLRPSPYNGTSAIVLLPHAALMNAEAETTAGKIERTEPSVFLPFRQRRRASVTPRQPPAVAAAALASIAAPADAQVAPADAQVTSADAHAGLPEADVAPTEAQVESADAHVAPADAQAVRADAHVGPADEDVAPASDERPADDSAPTPVLAGNSVAAAVPRPRAEVVDLAPESSAPAAVSAAGAVVTESPPLPPAPPPLPPPPAPPLPKRIPLAARTAAHVVDPIRAAGRAAHSMADSVRAPATAAPIPAAQEPPPAEDAPAAEQPQAESRTDAPVAVQPVAAESATAEPVTAEPPPANPPPELPS